MILRIALPAPVNRLFDYLPPSGVSNDRLRPGQRLKLPFGRRHLTGVLVEIAAQSTLPPEKLKRAGALIDNEPLLAPELLRFLKWSWRYYHHPPGEVVAAALPVLLRRGKPVASLRERSWGLTDAGAAVLSSDALARAPRQREVVAALADGPLTESTLQALSPGARPALGALQKKQLIAAGESRAMPALTSGAPARAADLQLNDAQARAVTAITEKCAFSAFLLEGVAGSGKTEVYLNAIQALTGDNRQALVLVPEISLTPQLLARFKHRLGDCIVVLHSGMNHTERARAWLAARNGEARVVLGTRSAIFTPLKNPGLIVVDEEHDLSFKQQDGFRYSARDLSLVRAQQLDVPLVLGSATPSLESLYNARSGRYQRLALPVRAAGASPPRVDLLDIRAQPMLGGLSARLLELTQTHLERGEQVLLFLNRRGFAPVMLCHACGWHARCERCDAHLTVHQRSKRLLCHHCESSRPIPAVCPECAGAAMLYGAGTERIEAVLKERFPDTQLLRVDRDTTRRRGAMETMMHEARRPGARILIGTQMLAKGHHLPEVTLVGVVNIDQMLFSGDFRATERLAQLLIQVAGRAGRSDKPGRVLVQTHHPEHALLRTLIGQGYAGFAEQALEERRALALPPFGYLALLRAEAHETRDAERFLQQAASQAGDPPGVSLSGPVPATMERRQGRYRQQLLIQAQQRPLLQQLLDRWMPGLYGLPSARKVRWSLDVDPQDLL